jgi:O-antigen ligase
MKVGGITYGGGGSAGIDAAPSQPVPMGGALRLLPFLPLLAIPFTGTDPRQIDQIIVAMETMFLVMALRDPVWVLGAIALSELTIKNYFLDLGGAQISTRLFISVVAFLIAVPILTRPLDLGPRARPVLLSLAAFAAISTIANAASSDMTYVFKFGRFLATGCIATILFATLIRTREDVQRVAQVVLVVGLASAVAAVFQHYEFRGAPVIAVVPNDIFPDGLDAWSGRALGLTEHPVYLTNDLFLLLFPLASLILLRAVPERSIPSLVVLALVVFAALYFTQTRSWVYSAAFAAVATAMVLKGRRSQELMVVLVLLGGAFWYWSERTGNRYTLGPESDDSAATRPVLWSAAFNIAMDNPALGVGHDSFLDLSPQYAERIDASLLERQGAAGALGQYTPHNDFLNVWLSFGTLALFAYLGLIWFSASNFVWAYKTFVDPALQALALGSFGALMAFSVNSLFHNFFDSTLVIWILAGFSVALAGLAGRLQAAPGEEETR